MACLNKFSKCWCGIVKLLTIICGAMSMDTANVHRVVEESNSADQIKKCLAKMTMVNLKELCREKSIANYSGLRKNELVSRIASCLFAKQRRLFAKQRMLFARQIRLNIAPGTDVFFSDSAIKMRGRVLSRSGEWLSVAGKNGKVFWRSVRSVESFCEGSAPIDNDKVTKAALARLNHNARVSIYLALISKTPLEPPRSVPSGVEMILCEKSLQLDLQPAEMIKNLSNVLDDDDEDCMFEGNAKAFLENVEVQKKIVAKTNDLKESGAVRELPYVTPYQLQIVQTKMAKISEKAAAKHAEEQRAIEQEQNRLKVMCELLAEEQSNTNISSESQIKLSKKQRKKQNKHKRQQEEAQRSLEISQKERECSICLEGFDFLLNDCVEYGCRFGCRCFYHKSCLKSWENTSGTCPICR